MRESKKIPKKWESPFPGGQMNAVLKLGNIVENEVCIRLLCQKL